MGRRKKLNAVSGSIRNLISVEKNQFCLSILSSNIDFSNQRCTARCHKGSRSCTWTNWSPWKICINSMIFIHHHSMKPISIPRKNFSISRISKQIQQLHWYKILKNLKSQWFCWLVNTQLVKRHSSNIFSNQSSPECESVPSQPPTVSSSFHKETKMKLQARYQKVLYLVMPLLLIEQSHSELFRLLVMHFFQGKLHYIISYNLYVLISKFSKDCNVPKWRIKYSNQFQSSIPLVFYLEKNKE